MAPFFLSSNNDQGHFYSTKNCMSTDSKMDLKQTKKQPISIKNTNWMKATFELEKNKQTDKNIPLTVILNLLDV